MSDHSWLKCPCGSANRLRAVGSRQLDGLKHPDKQSHIWRCDECEREMFSYIFVTTEEDRAQVDAKYAMGEMDLAL